MQHVFLLRLPNQAQKSTRMQQRFPQGFEQNVLWKKANCICLDPLFLSGFHLTSKSGSSLSLSSKVTSASPSNPWDLSLLTCTVRGGDSGRQTHSLLTGVPPLPADTADGSPRTFPGSLDSAPESSSSSRLSSHSHLTAIDLRDATLRLEGS